jgi:stage II sporulation protein P
LRPGLGVFLAIFFLVFTWVFLPGIQHLARAGTGAVLDWSLRDPQKIVNNVLPVWLGGAHLNPGENVAGMLGRVAWGNLGDPRRLIASRASVRDPVPTAPVVSTPVVSAMEAVRRTEYVPEGPTPEKPGKITVAIYHTHTGETYQSTDGVERFDGRPGAVAEVGRVVQRVLQERHGIGVAHSEQVHDVPYSRSYLESEKTVRRMLGEHPDLKVLLDIHRDSIRDRSYVATNIGGREVATILLVVGSDARRPFPTWRKNFNFARTVAAKAQELYPGLIVGVRVKEGRYNQFLHPGALLIEVGGVANHTAEALRTAELLADVLAAVLAGEAGKAAGAGNEAAE